MSSVSPAKPHNFFAWAWADMWLTRGLGTLCVVGTTQAKTWCLFEHCLEPNLHFPPNNTRHARRWCLLWRVVFFSKKKKKKKRKLVSFQNKRLLDSKFTSSLLSIVDLNRLVQAVRSIHIFQSIKQAAGFNLVSHLPGNARVNGPFLDGLSRNTSSNESRTIRNPPPPLAESQLFLSANASKGEAEAWTPLSPVLGLEVKPSSSHLARIIPRRESTGASAGLVGPRTFPLKSAQDKSAELHSNNKVRDGGSGGDKLGTHGHEEAIENVHGLLSFDGDQSTVEPTPEFLLDGRSPGGVQLVSSDPKNEHKHRER